MSKQWQTFVGQSQSTGMLQFLLVAVFLGYPVLQNLMGQAGDGQGSGTQARTQTASLRNGQEVVISGLRQSVEYNGMRGNIVAYIPGDSKEGRPNKYKVKLRNRDDEKTLAIRED